jgi:hypothetical protein
VAFEVLSQGWEAMVYRFYGVVFVVDALWSRGRSEVFVCSLAAVSWWRVVVNGAIDIFELKRIDKWLQAVGHGLSRIRIDDEYGAHFVVSGIVTVTVFAH